jgi:hypothetical protein
MSWEGYTFFLLRAIGPTPQQLVQLLTPTGGRYPQTDAEFEALQTQLRRIGHIVENAPHNIGSYLRTHRAAAQHFTVDGWSDHNETAQGHAFMTADQPQWQQGRPDPWSGGHDPWASGGTSMPPAPGAAFLGQPQQQPQHTDAEAEDYFTDSETDSSDCYEPDYSEITPSMTPAQVDEHLYWQYRQAKKNWRGHMRKPTRRVRRVFRSKGKGKGKPPSAKGKGKRRFAFLESTSTEEWDQAFYGGKSRSKGKRRVPGSKGKGKGGSAGSSRTNPIGRDGSVMLCSICGSDSHFRAECPDAPSSHFVAPAVPVLQGPLGDLLSAGPGSISFHSTETITRMTSSMPQLT